MAMPGHRPRGSFLFHGPTGVGKPVGRSRQDFMMPFAESRSLKTRSPAQTMDIFLSLLEERALTALSGDRVSVAKFYLLRCELESTFFHLYLGSTHQWSDQPAAFR
jgi:hypothetical protein